MLRIAVLLVLGINASSQDGCNVYNFGSWDAPIFSSSTYEVLYPPTTNAPDNRNISLPIGETMIITCKNGYFQSMRSTTTVLATCNEDSQLEIQESIVDFDTINCINHSPHSVKITNTPCGPDSVLIEVGFQIGLNIRFVPQLRVCFDVKNLVPLYTSYNLTRSIGFIKSYLSTDYVLDTVYDEPINFEYLYNFTAQREVINKLVGLPEDSSKYVNLESCMPNPGVSTPGYCFSKRPLAYRGGFVYVIQQHVTYRYINVVPQWYFLDYNLDKLERNVIDFVKRSALDLEIYTGTYRTATLPHEVTGEEVELFLYINEDVKAIPVPLIFWKLIYNRESRAATVFLVVNDPYQTDISKNVICEDISNEFDWLTWEKDNVTKGYGYACSYEDVRNVIPYFPAIEVNGVLGNLRS